MLYSESWRIYRLFEIEELMHSITLKCANIVDFVELGESNYLILAVS